MRQRKDMMTRLGLGLFLLLGAGVARAQAPSWQWEPADKVERADPARYPKAPAVVLLREERYTYTDHLTRLESRGFVHDRIAILTEAGLPYASFRIAFSESERLHLLKARTLQPDGTAQEVEPSEVKEDQIKLPERFIGVGKVKYRAFRLPGVQVGSIVEYAYEIEFVGGLKSRAADIATSGSTDPGLTESFIEGRTRRVTSGLPVARYRVTFEADRSIASAIKLFNLASTPPAQQEQKGNVGRITLELKDLPGDFGEAFLPPWRLHEPWWIFRLISYTPRGEQTRPLNTSWNRTLAGWVRRKVALMQLLQALGHTNIQIFLLEELLERAGGIGRVDRSLKDCQGAVTCIAEESLALIRTHTFFKEFADSAFTDSGQKPKEILDGGATSNEMSFLLWLLLERAKVDVYYAFTSRYIGRQIDKEFPDTAQFDHVLLYLPVQEGLNQPLWIDPSCEYCRVGEIPPWVEGAEAAVMTLVDTRYGRKGDVQFMPVAGTPAQGSQERCTYEAQLDERGDLVVSVNDEARGASAMRRQLDTRTWTAEKRRDDVGDFVRQRAATARLEQEGEMRCDKANGKCRRTLRFVVPGYATRKGAELLVPLTLLHSPWDQTFLDKERHGDLFFGESKATAEVLRLQLPPGWEVAEMPESARIQSPTLDYSLSVNATPGTLSVTRWLQTHAGRFGKAEYPSAREVTRAFAAVREKVLVLRKTRAP
ncbi:MAG TPA: DUF3857 domain-containing protein [Polyangia bacterium]|nr:DUF3857 domain-containing protein [Polyangia bacterium]